MTRYYSNMIVEMKKQILSWKYYDCRKKKDIKSKILKG